MRNTVYLSWVLKCAWRACRGENSTKSYSKQDLDPLFYTVEQHVSHKNNRTFHSTNTAD